jgi:hypothetical protein
MTERSYLAVVQHGEAQHEQETELVTIREENGLPIVETEGLRITCVQQVGEVANEREAA